MAQSPKRHLDVLMMNCDHLVNLDDIKKQMFDYEIFAVKTTYFSLRDMVKTSEDIKNLHRGEFDLGVLAVHANESRLSINEPDAGIGYAKIYQALLHAADEMVVIVIAHDNNCTDETKSISKWAFRKIASQFPREYLDGPTSRVFSWKKHPYVIHRNAVCNYLRDKYPTIDYDGYERKYIKQTEHLANKCETAERDIHIKTINVDEQIETTSQQIQGPDITCETKEHIGAQSYGQDPLRELSRNPKPTSFTSHQTQVPGIARESNEPRGIPPYRQNPPGELFRSSEPTSALPIRQNTQGPSIGTLLDGQDPPRELLCSAESSSPTNRQARGVESKEGICINPPDRDLLELPKSSKPISPTRQPQCSKTTNEMSVEDAAIIEVKDKTVECAGRILWSDLKIIDITQYKLVYVYCCIDGKPDKDFIDKVSAAGIIDNDPPGWFFQQDRVQKCKKDNKLCALLISAKKSDEFSIEVVNMVDMYVNYCKLHTDHTGKVKNKKDCVIF